MKNMTTIKELNNKIWYRLLKVISGSFLILLIISVPFIMYDNNKLREISYYNIECNYGNKKILNSIENNIKIKWINSAPTLETNKKIIKICEITEEDELEYLEFKNKLAEFITTSREYNISDSEIYSFLQEKDMIVSDNIKYNELYKIVQVTSYKKDYFQLFYVLLAIFFLLLLAKISQKLFYYVVLGNYNPPKN